MAGRPSTFTEETADAICDAMTEGESLLDICARPEMPNRRTVYRWMDENLDFASRCARAREGQADFMDHKILTVADACTPESAQADRVKISAYQWRAAKLCPKRYGDKLEVEGKIDLSLADRLGRAIARSADDPSGQE